MEYWSRIAVLFCFYFVVVEKGLVTVESTDFGLPKKEVLNKLHLCSMGCCNIWNQLYEECSLETVIVQATITVSGLCYECNLYCHKLIQHLAYCNCSFIHRTIFHKNLIFCEIVAGS